MAKKARRRLDEEEQFRSFRFPVFDESAFVKHEFEQSVATGIVFGFAVALGLFSFALTTVGLPWFGPLILGIVVIAFSPTVVRRLRPSAQEYTRGDWAGLLMLQIFGWLGLWFLFTNVIL
jgi:hypothetical protein